MHIDSNLPPKDNLQKEDKSSAPKVSFIQRFDCIVIFTLLYTCTAVVCRAFLKAAIELVRKLT